MGHMKDFDRRIRQGGDDAIAAVNELLQLWIPVSERLPELGEPVLACWSRQKVGMGTAVMREWCGKVAWRNVDQVEEIDEPIAWMPLPEPPEVK